MSDEGMTLFEMRIAELSERELQSVQHARRVRRIESDPIGCARETMIRAASDPDGPTPPPRPSDLLLLGIAEELQRLNRKR